MDETKDQFLELTHSVLAPPFDVGKNLLWTPSAAIWRRWFKYIRTSIVYTFPEFGHFIGLNLYLSQPINQVNR